MKPDVEVAVKTEDVGVDYSDEIEQLYESIYENQMDVNPEYEYFLEEIRKNIDELPEMEAVDIEGGLNSVNNCLPNFEKATINPKKLTEYALNPEHPVGGNKAKVFESALGYNKSNAEELMNQVYSKLPQCEAVEGLVDQYGKRFTVNMPITGPNGNTVNVRTGWIIKTGSEIPELTTIYVK